MKLAKESEEVSDIQICVLWNPGHGRVDFQFRHADFEIDTNRQLDDWVWYSRDQ